MAGQTSKSYRGEWTQQNLHKVLTTVPEADRLRLLHTSALLCGPMEGPRAWGTYVGIAKTLAGALYGPESAPEGSTRPAVCEACMHRQGGPRRPPEVSHQGVWLCGPCFAERVE